MEVEQAMRRTLQGRVRKGRGTRSWTIAVTCVLTAFCLELPVAWAQNSKPEAMRATTSTPSPDETADQTKAEGIALIEQAIAEGSAYGPGTRASLYFLAGHALAKGHPELAADMFKGAYRTLEELPDEKIPGVGMLKGNITHETAMALPEQVEETLPQEQSMREMAIATLVDVYVAKKKIDHAIELASQLQDPAIFVPVHNLLNVIPKKDADKRARVFSFAVDQYRKNHHTANIISFPDELGSLTTRFWNSLPSPLVIDAINVLLNDADTENQKDSNARTESIFLTVQSPEGTKVAGFYDYRLNQVIPILRELDPPRAKGLSERQKALLDLRQAGGPPASLGPEKPQLSVARDSVSMLRAAEVMQRRRFIDEMVSSAKEDPETAINKSSRLTDVAARAEILVGIAKAYATKDPEIANAALARIEIGDNPKRLSLGTMKNAADVAQKLGDKDLARAFVEACFKIARASYDHDSDRDHPNKALKLYWPSTHAWRDAFQLACGLAPEYAIEMLKTVPDPEIKAIQEIFVASSLLKVAVWNGDSPIGD
jgi:hypothetical protein